MKFFLPEPTRVLALILNIYLTPGIKFSIVPVLSWAENSFLKTFGSRLRSVSLCAGKYSMTKPVIIPLASGRSHWKVIWEGWTSSGSKDVRAPGSDSLVANWAEIGAELLWIVVDVPEN